MAYCTRAEVKTYIGLGAATEHDDEVDDFIENAQAIIEQTTNKLFEAASDTTRYFDAVEDVDGRTLRFDKPIVSFTTVVNGDGITVSSSEYVKEPRNFSQFFAIRLLNSSGKVWSYVTDPENAIAVTGKWTYSLTAPNNIRQAAIRLTAWLYKQPEGYSADLDRPTITSDGVILMPPRLPNDVLSYLAPYIPKL